MQDEDNENKPQLNEENVFAATIRINAGQGLRVASKKLERHLRSIKFKPIKLKLKG